MFACPAHRGAAILLDLSGDLPFADPFHLSDGHWTASLCILPLEVWVGCKRSEANARTSSSGVNLLSVLAK